MIVRPPFVKCLFSTADASETLRPVAARRTYNACSWQPVASMSFETASALRDGRFCSEWTTIGKSVVSASQVRLKTGSPFGPFSDFTTCFAYSTYLFTVRGLNDADIFSTIGFNARL